MYSTIIILFQSKAVLMKKLLLKTTINQFYFSVNFNCKINELCVFVPFSTVLTYAKLILIYKWYQFKDLNILRLIVYYRPILRLIKTNFKILIQELKKN